MKKLFNYRANLITKEFTNRLNLPETLILFFIEKFLDVYDRFKYIEFFNYYKNKI